MNGQIEIEFSGTKVTVMGGPYRDKPNGVPGVKLAKEIDLPCDIKLDIRDFSVPDEEDVHMALVETMIALKYDDPEVYVGCMGGIGRTGMFMAMLATAIAHYNQRFVFQDWWEFIWRSLPFVPRLSPAEQEWQEITDNPVLWIRQNYLNHAVETSDQQQLVNEFDYDRVVAEVYRICNGVEA